MRKNITSFTKLVVTFLFALLICTFTPATLLAYTDEYYPDSEPVWENDDTDYEIYIDDLADLLSSREEKKLLETMKPISEHGHVAFVSIDYNPEYDTEDYVEEYYYDHFRHNSGTVFIIDMDERNIWIYSDGDIYDRVTTAYANTITDNVYTFASDEEYFDCANTAFEQINSLMEGKAIAQPMKYISNALLAIVIALLINYISVLLVSRSKKVSDSQLLDGTFFKVNINNPSINFTHQTKEYSPESSDSSGSSSSGGGGGGGGGGSSSGGGGGHSF